MTDEPRRCKTPERCPECGGDSAVVDSRARATHRWRMRRCLSVTCRHKWETFESLVNPDDLPRQMVERLGA